MGSHPGGRPWASSRLSEPSFFSGVCGVDCLKGFPGPDGLPPSLLPPLLYQLETQSLSMQVCWQETQPWGSLNLDSTLRGGSCGACEPWKAPWIISLSGTYFCMVLPVILSLNPTPTLS